MSDERREELQDILESILTSSNVYFQPPETVKMTYPCIVYSRLSGDTKFAGDKPYSFRILYQVIVIDKDPDSVYPARVASLPECVFDRHYTSNNLNHDVFNVYY